MKLSKRVKQIESMVAPGYDHIWDCCCDHGYLGAELLSRQAAPTVHFVDIVPPLIISLEEKLKQFYPDPKPSWETHCIDVAKLPLGRHQGRHLVIIAGVGGELINRFIEGIDGIAKNSPAIELDLLLCPVHHQYSVRQKLIKLNYSLIDEVIIEENRRFYEIIYISAQADKSAPISPVGNKMWLTTQPDNIAITKRYLSRCLNHYQRIEQGNRNHAASIAAAYQAIELPD